MIRDLAKGFTMHGAETLLKDAGYIPADKLDWKPEASGKSVVELLNEIASANRLFAVTFKGDMSERKAFEETDFETLKKLVMETSAQVCEAIDELTDEQLAGEIKMPWGQSFPAAAAVFLAAQHMNYHDGQVNYIQLLLGDTKFHWMEE